ncbi:MAG: undecaprenyldiphospho-muramoylpentapeptide beta-N-acetylglucosaminyltransferase [Deltaproteobacteria bacterium]|nr:undecaprenyldiphospho-muramoylpentapeptide beta-N-acetylglucosaminyltransferase [Deltaproteobacteria bacterium]
MLRLAVAGGGTGGHVFPGMAVIEALRAEMPVDVLWIGTGRPMEKALLDSRGWDYRVLAVRPLTGFQWISRLKSLLTLPYYVALARKWLKEFKPHVVLGVGGYVSGPVLVAAWLLGIPAALHEQNMLPGLANRISARFVRRILVSFEGTMGLLHHKDIQWTGNPIRSELVSACLRPRVGLDGHRLLVLGGSQGASTLNRLVSSAVTLLSRSGFFLEVWHQTGKVDEETVRNLYEEAGVNAKVTPFIEDMAQAYSWANLVVARAGAGTVAEVAATGTPAVFVPYTGAAGHQEANAMYLVQKGAALCFRENEMGAVRLASEIQRLLDDGDILGAMSERAFELARPDAAERIATALLGLRK